MAKPLRIRGKHFETAIRMGKEIKHVSCAKKVKFSSEMAHKVGADYNQRAYLCERCGHWHLTKNVGAIHKGDGDAT